MPFPIMGNHAYSSYASRRFTCGRHTHCLSARQTVSIVRNHSRLRTKDS